MKITKFLFVCLLGLFFSCSEDEGSKPVRPTVEKLIGTWDMTAVDYSGTTTTTYDGESIKATFTGTGKDIEYTSTFSTDPNTVVSEGSYTIRLKTTFAGQSSTEDHLFEDALMSGTWELDGDKLIITNDGLSQEAVITKQTDTALEAKVNLNETYSDSDLDITITTKVKAIYKFRKADQ